MIGALEEARKRGAFTASLACNKGSAVSHLADAAIEVVVVRSSSRAPPG